MNKIRRFDDVLDECLERLLVKGETIEQCLQSFPEYSDELKPLLETALASRRISDLQPRPEFRNRARYELHSALLKMEQKRSRSFFNLSWQPRWATAVGILLVISLVGGGTVAAASNSMPDSPLYAIKRATEQAQLALTFSEMDKAELYARLADKRVEEIVYLAEKDKPEEIVQVTASLNTNLARMTALVSPEEVVTAVSNTSEAPLMEVPPAVEGSLLSEQAPIAKETPDSEAGTTERGKAPEPSAKETPSTVATPPAQPAAAVPERVPAPEASPAPKEVAKQDKKEGATTEASAKTDRRNNLKTTVEIQAEANTARLRALLATAPESAKPAIERAIELAEAEYKKALKALENK